MGISKIILPSISVMLFLVVFLYLSFYAGKGLLNDGDTGYHIRAGEYIIENLTIPKNDIFSFHSPPIPWTAHEWLSEVIMAIIHKISGLTGVVIFFSFLIALTYSILFKILKSYKGNIFISLILIILVLSSSQIHWLARPHIFSLLIMTIWYFILDQFQSNNRNYLYLLPLIMLIWVNLHGGYMSGFILLGIYLFGNLVNMLFSDRMKELWAKKVKTLTLALIACLLVSLINPYGYHILIFPFKLTTNKFIMDNVHEFLSPNFHQPMVFTVMLFLMITLFAISKKSLNFIELLLVLVFTYMSLYSIRHVPLFAIIVSPILLRHSEDLLKNIKGRFADFLEKRSSRIYKIDSLSGGYLWIFLAFMAVIIGYLSGSIDYKFNEKMKPVAATEFLKRERIEGNMFNNDEMGDYIIYAAWPQYKVFFDGRSDMYGAERMKEYFKISRVQLGWDEVIEKYNIDLIIYNANSPLSLFLMERKDWHLIYADEVANIFVKNIPKYYHLIDKYPDVKLVVDKNEKGEPAQVYDN